MLWKLKSAIFRALAKKKDRNVYDKRLAPKAFVRLTPGAANKYIRAFLSPGVRLVAELRCVARIGPPLSVAAHVLGKSHHHGERARDPWPPIDIRAGSGPADRIEQILVRRSVGDAPPHGHPRTQRVDGRKPRLAPLGKDALFDRGGIRHHHQPGGWGGIVQLISI